MLKRAVAHRRFRHRPDYVMAARLHIASDSHTSASLARLLGISMASVSRVLAELRRVLSGDGMELVSTRSPKGFRYEIRDPRRAERVRAFRKGFGFVKGPDATNGRSVDDVLYGD